MDSISQHKIVGSEPTEVEASLRLGIQTRSAAIDMLVTLE
jgi:hypothetical protein